MELESFVARSIAVTGCCFYLLAGTALFSACDDSDDGAPTQDDADGDGSSEDALYAPRESTLTVPFATDCVSPERPIVMAHGFLASGDTWGNHVRRFVNNGYCIDELYTFEYDSIAIGTEVPTEEQLDAFIDEVRAQNDGEQVDLMGHSAGGNLGYKYLSNARRAEKVAHYVHVASFDNDGPAGPASDSVPTLNLYSLADEIVSKNDGIDGAENVQLTEEDHYEVATSAASFNAIYRFLHDDAAPTTTEIGNSDEAWIYGRVVSLGSNVPQAGRTVEIYEVTPETGIRRSEDASETFVVTERGYWGPFLTSPGEKYELFVAAKDPEDVAIHYYIEPAQASNPLVYLRTLPAPDSLAGAFISGLPTDSATGIIIVFFANGAIEVDKDDVQLGDVQLATEEVAAPASTTIALFMYDSDDDMSSSFDLISVFKRFPFLNGLDVYFDPGSETGSTVTANGVTLTTPHWSTDEEGLSILIFD